MKTAAQELLEAHPEILVGNHKVITKALDVALLVAFKAGAEWAAKIHQNNNESYNKRMEVAAILSAAQQLTEIPK